MLTKRVIPCLDVKNGRVVKGVNFVSLRDAGDPVELAAAYDREGADEVVFLDRPRAITVPRRCSSPPARRASFPFPIRWAAVSATLPVCARWSRRVRTRSRSTLRR